MKTTLNVFAAAAAASVIAGAIAVAAPGSTDITVTATRLPAEKVTVQTTSGSFYKEFRVSTKVSAAGLDLSTAGGAAALEQRVNDAALAACQEITRLYPNATPDEATCAKAAAKAAMPKAKALEAAAGKTK